MKRKIAVLWMMFLCTQSLAGCQKTPEDVIVTEKNKDNISNNETAENTGTSLRKEINAPGNYKKELSRIDNKSGVLVPVWDFYGGIDADNKDGSSSKDNGKYSNESFMTINAVDGTVIDRALGY